MTVCRYHGGGAKQVRAAAARRTAAAAAGRLAQAYVAATAEAVTDPVGVLLQLAGEQVAFKDYLAGTLEELRADQWRYRGVQAEQVNAWVGLYERSLDACRRLLVDIARLGLEEKRADQAERYGTAMLDVIRELLDRLDLSDEQQQRVAVVLPLVVAQLTRQIEA